MEERTVRVWKKGYWKVNKEGKRTIFVKGKYIRKKFKFPTFKDRRSERMKLKNNYKEV